MDLLLRNAKLLNGRITDIAIEDGHIVKLEPDLELSAKEEHNLEKQLTLAAFVNGQLHACKVFWRRNLKQLNPELQKLARFQAAKHVKANYTENDVYNRVHEVMRLAIAHGSCAIRLFADVDEASGLNALKGLLRIKETFAPFMSVQVVAFPQDGVFAGNTQELMTQALELGADVVGGIPWIEKDEASQKAHTEMCFDLAKRFNKDLHLVCDDTPNPESRTLEYVARQTLETKFAGNVAVTQCAALAFYDDAYAEQVIKLVKQANLTVFANSHVSLVTTEKTIEPYARGITRVKQLLAAGVPVACAQDDIDNWYYPFGRNDMLEVAQFMAHVGGFAWQPEHVLPMVSSVPARVLGLEKYGLELGSKANLVVLDAQNWQQAIQFQSTKSFVILKGQVLARTSRITDFSPILT